MEDYGSRISKIKRGESVIVNVIAEPFQDMYNVILRKTDEMKALMKSMSTLYKGFDETPAEQIEAMMTLDYELEALRNQFWLAVNKQYNTWKIGGVGLRNGYCLVKMRDPKELMNIIKRKLDEIKDEIGLETNEDENE